MNLLIKVDNIANELIKSLHHGYREKEKDFWNLKISDLIITVKDMFICLLIIKMLDIYNFYKIFFFFKRRKILLLPSTPC